MYVKYPSVSRSDFVTQSYVSHRIKKTLWVYKVYHARSKGHTSAKKVQHARSKGHTSPKKVQGLTIRPKNKNKNTMRPAKLHDY